MPPAADLVLRRAQPADAPALRAILYDTFESTWRPQITAAAAEAFRAEDRPAVYVAERGLEFWVAERHGEIAGFVDWQDDFVNALHVRSAHARTGVGSRLMDKAEAEIAAAGFTTARLETDTFNARSQAFYAARGYTEADRYPDQEWDSGLVTLLLVKALGSGLAERRTCASGGNINVGNRPHSGRSGSAVEASPYRLPDSTLSRCSGARPSLDFFVRTRRSKSPEMAYNSSP